MKTPLLLLTLLVFAWPLRAQEFAPGSETPITIPGYTYPALVYVPTDYTADREWPLVLFFHGSGGRPTTGLPRTFTGGTGFVIVGMDFTVDARTLMTREVYAQEVQALNHVKAQVAAKLKVNPKRVYVGGFSMGGWVASRLTEAYLPDIAGAFILGAGQNPGDPFPPKRGPDKRNVYIGVGQLESNYPWGVMAIDLFRSLNCEVSFEMYPGLGHSVPTGPVTGTDVFNRMTTSFQQWWAIERHRDDPAPLREPVLRWFEAEKALAAKEDVAANLRFLALTRAKQRPFYRYLAAAQRKELDAAMAGLKQAAVVAESAAMGRYQQLILRENLDRTYSKLLEAAHAYHQAYTQAPETYYGTLAELSAGRLREQLSNPGRWAADPKTQARIQEQYEARPLAPVPVDELIAIIRSAEESIWVGY